jgi:NhaA family Na+:H+ antiporter
LVERYYNRIVSEIRQFIALETAGGIILLTAALLALVFTNTPLAGFYHAFLDLPVAIRIGEFSIAKPLLLWINDGLMAVFFLLVGLEIKREVLDGELSSRETAMLPGIAALGGMLVPALLYVSVNHGDPVALRGWAIPAATDIAFAIGALSLLGRRAPIALKIFLLALAIIDDLGAIVIIAAFYTGNLAWESLALAALVLAAMIALNLRGVARVAPYVLLGIVLWVCVLKSGVHGTLAGVAIALTVPLRPAGAAGPCPLKKLEHELHPWVTYLIMPLFGFANAGISFAGLAAGDLTNSIMLGILAGLLIGKPVGIMLFAWLAVRIGLARLPDGLGWTHMIGAALLAGIGFTMSLFIGTLAWEGLDVADDNLVPMRLGVLGASIVAGILGFLWLRLAAREPPAPET